eukprot:gnl/TRDRNA2_/TRDRNA2_171534_c1_seq2.p1 gnl/TRDRNA2_/TRDRNA2_171534_c1~~gnl/TRDRNA2_/TRDRNA2_171534_c1_seq2.p1  ORF type:complete len:114 (-),score=9.72 gnl/TRDRNA2_/TRDRNA2_171534_c1_seq2:258-599(-)
MLPPRTNAFITAFDATKMRLQLLRSPKNRKMTFAFAAELMARNITTACDSGLDVPALRRTLMNQTYNNFIRFMTTQPLAHYWSLQRQKLNIFFRGNQLGQLRRATERFKHLDA